MSKVELREYYSFGMGNYKNHKLKLLNFPTILIYYEHGFISCITTEIITEEETKTINDMDSENFFHFINNQKTFVVNRVTMTDDKEGEET